MDQRHKGRATPRQLLFPFLPPGKELAAVRRPFSTVLTDGYATLAVLSSSLTVIDGVCVSPNDAIHAEPRSAI